MQQLKDVLETVRSVISDHTIETLMMVIVAVAITFVLALWSLLRRRAVRRLARSMRDMHRRLDALERAEQDRTVRRIVAPDQPPA